MKTDKHKSLVELLSGEAFAPSLETGGQVKLAHSGRVNFTWLPRLECLYRNLRDQCESAYYIDKHNHVLANETRQFVPMHLSWPRSDSPKLCLPRTRIACSSRIMSRPWWLESHVALDWGHFRGWKAGASSERLGFIRLHRKCRRSTGNTSPIRRRKSSLLPSGLHFQGSYAAGSTRPAVTSRRATCTGRRPRLGRNHARVKIWRGCGSCIGYDKRKWWNLGRGDAKEGIFDLIHFSKKTDQI